MLAELLGTSVDRIREIEADRMKVPKILPVALIAVEKPLRTAARAELRRRAAGRERARVRHNERRRVAHRRVRRADAAAQLAKLRELEKSQHRENAETLRRAARYVTAMEKRGEIRVPGAPILRRPERREVRPRKVRSDVGRRHRFRGRPGLRLRPEDIAHETT